MGDKPLFLEVPAVQQNWGSYCGLFAIAFAYHIILADIICLPFIVLLTRSHDIVIIYIQKMVIIYVS